jgi:coenzyme F420 hydrogenase subunit beta
MCVALAEVRERPGRYAFVGKPCEVRALRRLQDRFPELRERVVLAVGVFCAQTPARSRTKAFLESRGIDPQQVHAVAYRGAGWPGRFRAWNATGIVCEVPYREAWDFLAAGTQGVACLLCSDGVAAEADVSAGDPWFLAAESPMGDGRTLVAVWTDLGKEAVAGAASAGTIVPNELEGEWRAKLCHAQTLRSATAAHRRAVYGVVFGERRLLLGLLRSRLTCLPTLLRRRLARAYY